MILFFFILPCFLFSMEQDHEKKILCTVVSDEDMVEVMQNSLPKNTRILSKNRCKKFILGPLTIKALEMHKEALLGKSDNPMTLYIKTCQIKSPGTNQEKQYLLKMDSEIFGSWLYFLVLLNKALWQDRYYFNLPLGKGNFFDPALRNENDEFAAIAFTTNDSICSSILEMIDALLKLSKNKNLLMVKQKYRSNSIDSHFK